MISCVKYYYSAPFRGPDGDHADKDVIKDNINRAITTCGVLRIEHPKHRFYCPHQYQYQLVPWEKGDVSSEDILQHCCDIVLLCDVLLFEMRDVSEGMELEREVASANGIQVVEWKGHADLFRKIAV